MGKLLTPLDYTVFFVSLIVVMIVGLWAGRKEDTSSDYYLAGKSTRWWGVAGSIFGSNVSANHMVGMMGLGFSVGFAQSHFEISAIAGLLALCYIFLPMYRKLNLYTLSEYLSRRYNDSCRLAYATIMILVIVVIQMVPGYYIGSRSLNVLLQGGPGEIDFGWYVVGIVGMAVVTGTYTIAGGLKAVIITDVIQSLLVLVAGIAVAIITFAQPEVGGWSGMIEQDAAVGGAHRMEMYNPSSHPELPWTGVLTGLMVLHFYYWGTNQFIVQRALSARSDAEARFGIIAAGFFKLLIPFFSIGTGIAAFYLFRARNMEVHQDAVFTTLLTHLVAPLGFGLVGLVAAGLLGAILSSIDSMMNSAATIITFDVYQRYVRPDASERQLILVGRICIVAFILISSGLTIFTMDPNSEKSFFLHIAQHQSKLVAGVVVAFLLGMLWKRATSAGALAAIAAGVFFSYIVPLCYPFAFRGNDTVIKWLGPDLNFMHSVFLAAILAAVCQVVVSLCTKPSENAAALTWVGAGVLRASTIRSFLVSLVMSLSLYAALAVLMVRQTLTSPVAAVIAAGWTWYIFVASAVKERSEYGQSRDRSILADDRLLAGLLAATAIFMMYYFY